MAAHLKDFEGQLQAAYASGAALAAFAVKAQRLQGLSPTAGHQALGAISNANMSVSGALSHAAAAHRLMEQLAARLGFDVTSYGENKDPAFTGADASHLDVAA